jgi:hypothetical protein
MASRLCGAALRDALSRQILALTGQLETISLAKKPAQVKPPVNHAFVGRPPRKFPNEAMGGAMVFYESERRDR